MNRRTETRSKRAQFWLLVIIAAVLWQIGAGSSLVRADTNSLLPPPPQLTNRLTVAILGFENKTGDPTNDHWRVAIEIFASNSLREIAAVRVMPGVNYALHEVNRTEGEPLTAEQAARAGRAIEARRVLWGSYTCNHGKWHVSVHVLDATTGKPSATFSATSTNWFELRDQMAKKMIGELSLHPSAEELGRICRRKSDSIVCLDNRMKAVYLSRKRASFAEIEKYARLAIAADPDSSAAQMELCSVLFNRGQTEEGVIHLRRALELDPNCAFAHLYLGYHYMSEEKYEQAESELLEAIRLDPDSEAGWERLGGLRFEQESPSSATACYQQAIRLNPFSVYAHAKLGVAYAVMGRREAALAELKRAELLSFSDNPSNDYNIAWAFDTLHEIPSAIAHYEKYIQECRKQGCTEKQAQSDQARLQKWKKKLSPQCVNAQPPQDYPAAFLAAALHQKLKAEELSQVMNPVASTPEMDRWARAIIGNHTNAMEKAQALFDVLARHVDDGPAGWRSAEETFAAWNKPGMFFRCQEYAFLYVALARAVGLRSYNVLVEKDWEGRQVNHACASVFIDGKALLVDPMYRWFGVPHQGFDIFDDLQTTALFMGCQSADFRLVEIGRRLSPDPKIQMYIISHLISAGRWNEARDTMAAVSWADEDFWRRDLLNAYFAHHNGNYEEALALLQKTIKANPDDDVPYRFIGSIYYRQRKFTEARDFYQQALKHTAIPEDRDLVRVTIASLNESIGDKGSNSWTEFGRAGEYVCRGDVRSWQGKLEAAITDYTRAIQLKPGLAAAFLHRGYAYQYQNRQPEALNDFDQAIVLDPRDVQNYEYRARQFLKEKNYDKAIKDFNAAIALRPAYDKLYDELARLYNDCLDPRIRDHKAALENAKKACELCNWSKSDYVKTLAIAYAANDDFENAIDCARKASYLPDTTPDGRKQLEQLTDEWEAARPGPKPLKSLSQRDLSTNLWIFTTLPTTNGTTSSTENAAKLRKSAETGDVRAQRRLASELYSGSPGVPANHVEAYKWAAIASGDDKEAKAYLHEFEIFMSADEISAGKAAATAFLKEFAKKK